jgi:hypothetical protein
LLRPLFSSWGAAVTFEAAMWTTPDAKRRLAIGTALLIAVVLAWAQGAVGIV